MATTLKNGNIESNLKLLCKISEDKFGDKTDSICESLKVKESLTKSYCRNLEGDG